MDRRQQKTRVAIFDALSSLLVEKGYNNISVQDIVNEANIGRSTFYAHFETKDDVLREFCSDIFKHVFSNGFPTESSHDFSKEGNDTHAVITHLFYHLLDNKKNIAGILTCESGELFLQYFKQFFDDLYTVKLLSGITDGKLNVPYEFMLNHISGSYINMIQWWIKGGMKQSPEEMTKYFEAVIYPVINL